MVEIADITCTCFACPSQWEGTTVDGEEIYIRYRWGSLRIDLDHETVFQQQLGDGLDGLIEWEDVEDILEEL
jgi:hypothetical protein